MECVFLIFVVTTKAKNENVFESGKEHKVRLRISSIARDQKVEKFSATEVDAIVKKWRATFQKSTSLT